eukprot:1156748-Pelagomonas_calceolata.AAC.9
MHISSQQRPTTSSSQPHKASEVPSTSTSQPLPAAAEIIFSRPEDQYFHEHCSWYYTFPVESRPVGKDGLQQCRLVMQIGLGKGPAYSDLAGCSGALTQTYLADLTGSMRNSFYP